MNTHDRNSYVVVLNAGMNNQETFESSLTFFEAVKLCDELQRDGDDASIMKRLNDGMLTTEY